MRGDVAGFSFLFFFIILLHCVLAVLWLPVFCVSHAHGALCWTVVCGSGNCWLYSLTFNAL